MTKLEHEILDTLVHLDEQVANITKVTPKPNLLPTFARLDELTGQLPAETDPSLTHYMRKKSYQKARLFLEGRESENQAGSCGHQP